MCRGLELSSRLQRQRGPRIRELLRIPPKSNVRSERDVHDLFWLTSRETGERFALQADEPAPLPHLEEEAA